HEPLGHADPGVAGGRPAPVLGTQREDRRYQREDALSQNLRTLVRDGLVKRTVTPTVPPPVSYSHTPLGADLTVQLWALVSWIGNHTNDILEAQIRHDAATLHPGAVNCSASQPPAAGVARPFRTIREARTAATGVVPDLAQF